jgi:hypothetical protein
MKNYTCRSRHSMFSQSLFYEKMIFFVLCIKKIKFGAKIGVARDNILSFLHKTQKMSGFPQNLAHAHRISRYMC